MVAITVIMAAIVAGFVFGVIQSPQATPTASVSIDSLENSSSKMVLLHQSGNSLNASEIEIVITDLDNSGKSTVINLSDTKVGGMWSAGERITIEESGSATDGNFAYPFVEGHHFEVRVIHTKSGGAISASTAEAQ
ncbi:MAG: Pilin/Flagellin, PilA family [Candidatus Methanohalarchaeum thermophilum]|uniref:Pilin/Flagellin, PilA family n=1 Tax=Methanohalarchaeum thermophilum TaxID=1903181 RepID=A0A1Q6DWB6_METT1|nr:MAG: Pilin/Flagellin, PilA family [Candidatus Methanohalarchaeum thermophilum]